MNHFIEAMGFQAQQMQELAEMIDEAIAQANGTEANAFVAQGKLRYIVKRLGSDYGAALAKMIGQYKTVWIEWTGKLDMKKDAKDKTRLLKAFDLIRVGQSALMDAVGRAKTALSRPGPGIRRKELDGPQASPTGSE
jgi:hypothetical protein